MSTDLTKHDTTIDQRIVIFLRSTSRYSMPDMIDVQSRLEERTGSTSGSPANPTAVHLPSRLAGLTILIQCRAQQADPDETAYGVKSKALQEVIRSSADSDVLRFGNEPSETDNSTHVASILASAYNGGGFARNCQAGKAGASQAGCCD